MGQEYFGGPEYFQEFDPEKFARELKAEQLKAQAQSKNQEDSEEIPEQ